MFDVPDISVFRGRGRFRSAFVVPDESVVVDGNGDPPPAAVQPRRKVVDVPVKDKAASKRNREEVARRSRTEKKSESVPVETPSAVEVGSDVPEAGVVSTRGRFGGARRA